MAQHTDPVLRYDGRVWRGEDSSMDVWMSDATFQSYVTAYLQTIDIKEPTTDQRADAVQHCRSVSYWHGVRDSKVHVRPVQGGAG